MDIIDDSYYAYQYEEKKIGKKLYASILATSLSIDNFRTDLSLILSLRNLFDILVLDEYKTYCKVHLNYENINLVIKKAYLDEKEVKESIPLNSLMIKIKINPETVEHLLLIIYANGNYTVKSFWREENHMDFKKITAIVASKVNPIIDFINQESNKIKYFNIKLPHISKANIIFTETSLVFYYDGDITDRKYQYAKKLFEDYSYANIIRKKESVSNYLEYFFAKGMYKYDSARIEKAITITNYYEYLSNNIIKQKWHTIFERTHLMQAENISSKLKINIVGIKNDKEMKIFHMMLLGFIYILEKNNEAGKSQVYNGQTNHKKTLKNLRVQDPLLYDFRKIYKSDIVYSRICQKPYQPIILSDQDYQHLSQDKKKKVVKYWNFTKEKPVWYHCPNSKYPYIKFIVKQHPKDFCIPCCKKMEMGENINPIKQEIHRTCLTEHCYSGEKQNVTKTNYYIATYGKDIEIGRLCRLPESTLEPLFFDTYSPDGNSLDQECITSDGYYILGIEQNFKFVNRVGYIFTISHALNMAIDVFLLETCKRIAASPHKYSTLLSGNINQYFLENPNNPDELIRTIKFLQTTMLPNKYNNVPWNEIFITIGYYYFGINTLVFDDMYGNGNINFVLPKGVKTTEQVFTSIHKNLVVIKRKQKYYPIYLINTELFKKTGIIDTRLFINESGLITIIKSVIRRHFETTRFEKIKTNIDINIIQKFVADRKRKITTYFVNYSNICYAVMIDSKFYIPIYSSYYSLDRDINIEFKPYTEGLVDFSDYMKLFVEYNDWVKTQSNKEKLTNVNIYPLLKVDKWLALMKNPDDIFGFIINDLYFYCKSMPTKKAKTYASTDVQLLVYDSREVNKIIYNIKQKGLIVNLNKATDLANNSRMNQTTKKVANTNSKNLSKSHTIKQNKPISATSVFETHINYVLYKTYLYQLLILQFINIFNKQKNVSLRKKIVVTLIKTNFNSITSRDDLKTLLDQIEKEYGQNDVLKLKKLISKYFVNHQDKAKLIEEINQSEFSFDKVLLEKLKKMEYSDVLTELKVISKTIVKIGDVDKKSFIFPNILMSCDTKSKLGYCVENKLIMSKKDLDLYLDLIAKDITNPFKKKWIFNEIFTTKYIEFFKFMRRPNETIKIEIL